MRRLLPGPGFALLVLTVVVAAGFFLWGLQRPKLEHVWRIQLGLEGGKRKPLSRAERELLSDAIKKHPELVDGMIGDRDEGIISANRDGLIENGYVYLIRRKSGPKRMLELIATDARGTKPIDVEVRTAAGEKSGTVVAGAPFHWELPNDGPFPELIEVRLREAGKRDRHAIVVRTRELAP